MQQARALAGRATLCLADDRGQEPPVESRPREGTDDGRPDVVDQLEPGPANIEPGGAIEQDRLHAIVQRDRGSHMEHDGPFHASRVGDRQPGSFQEPAGRPSALDLEA